jgi:hypothetical protein
VKRRQSGKEKRRGYKQQCCGGVQYGRVVKVLYIRSERRNHDLRARRSVTVF